MSDGGADYEKIMLHIDEEETKVGGELYGSVQSLERRTNNIHHNRTPFIKYMQYQTVPL